MLPTLAVPGSVTNAKQLLMQPGIQEGDDLQLRSVHSTAMLRGTYD